MAKESATDGAVELLVQTSAGETAQLSCAAVNEGVWRVEFVPHGTSTPPRTGMLAREPLHQAGVPVSSSASAILLSAQDSLFRVGRDPFSFRIEDGAGGFFSMLEVGALGH